MTTSARGVDSVQFQRDTIALPGTTRASRVCRLVELGTNGLADLLLVDPTENKLLVYRQKASGFGQNPDQTIPLPAQTAWIAVGDVDPHPGRELLLSIASGVVYLRQNDGAFETLPRKLIQASQVFANGTSLILTSLPQETDGTKDVIPVISAGQVVFYKRNGAFEWNPAPPMDYQMRKTNWSIGASDWMAGENSSWRMYVRETFQATPDENLNAAKKAENDAIKTLLASKENEQGKKSKRTAELEARWPLSGIQRVDVNGDGREDVVGWRVVLGMNVSSEIFVYLRDQDGKLPRQPSQFLHVRGFPLPSGPEHVMLPVCDLKGNGKSELVLAAIKTSIMSASGFVDTLVSGSLDWTLTIREFNGNGFSRSPDAADSRASSIRPER